MISLCPGAVHCWYFANNIHCMLEMPVSLCESGSYGVTVSVPYRVWGDRELVQF